MGLKEFCTLLLAGGMGAGSVVAVQEVKPRTQQVRPAPKAKPAVKRPAPARPQQAAAARLDDCPIYAPLAGSVLANLGVPANPQIAFGTTPIPGGAGGGAPWGPGPGGGGSGIDPFPPGGGAPIPEPAAWAMMVSGFGLLGLALRQGREESRTVSDPA
ncbi:MAG: PEPxxWA-CTERM sorting domain-containing protein [Thermaurantiacus sp.]